MPENGSGVVVCSSSLLLCSHPGRRQAETPLIQPVQKSRASSGNLTACRWVRSVEGPLWGAPWTRHAHPVFVLEEFGSRSEPVFQRLGYIFGGRVSSDRASVLGMPGRHRPA